MRELSNRDKLVPEGVDWKTVDLLSYMRREGLDDKAISLVEAVADVEVGCSTKKGYMEWLSINRNVHFTYPEICRLWANPVFQKCVDILTAQYEGAAIRAIKKNMMNRAASPTDSHAVAAAKLIFQQKGLLKGNESTGRDAGGAHNLVKLMMEYRDGQNGGGGARRRFTVISEELPPDEAPTVRKIEPGVVLDAPVVRADGDDGDEG